jgi:erythromycin esterase
MPWRVRVVSGWRRAAGRICLLLAGLWLAACGAAPELEDTPASPTLTLAATPSTASRSAPAGGQAVPPEIGAWLDANALPFDTVQPDAGVADLEPLQGLIGDARVVALGEATHGTHEFFQLKGRLVRFLVEEMGFNVFALEAYWSEANRINDYVQTGQGDPAELLAGLGYWPWNTGEMLDLVEWMREHNAGRGDAPAVGFYGFDMQSARLALDDVVAYLESVDPGAAGRAEAAFDCFRPFQDFTWQQAQYAAQAPETRAACRRDLQSVYDGLLQQQESYAAHSSPEAAADALQAARVILQNEAMAAVTAEGDFMTRERFDARDRAMAENVEWLLAQAGPDAKIILWAHNAHVQTAEWAFRGTRYTPMGVHLRRRYGDGLRVFGFTFYSGSFNAYAYDAASNSYGDLGAHPAGPLPADSHERYLHSGGQPRFFLDLRQVEAGPGVDDWLSASHWLRFVGAEYDSGSPPEDYAFMVRLPDAFDVLVYIEETTPSDLLP